MFQGTEEKSSGHQRSVKCCCSASYWIPSAILLSQESCVSLSLDCTFFVGILGCFIGERVAFLLMCSRSFALLVKQLSDFLIVRIKPVFMWARISAELRECTMVHRIYSESYQVFDFCSLSRRQCLSNFLIKSPLLVVFACGRRLDRICMLSFGQSSSLRCTAYHFC